MIAILTSGVALGVHVPGVLLARRLGERGIDARVEVFERLLPAGMFDRIARSRCLFRRDVRAALAGQALARDLSAALDPGAVEALTSRWRDQQVTRFVVLSGFWLPVLDRAVRSWPSAPAVDLCHVDAVRSPSWRVPGGEATERRARQAWLLDLESATVPCTIPVTSQEPLAWSARPHRVLCHGGGWGMGTYRDRSHELLARGIDVDIVIHDPADAADRAPSGSGAAPVAGSGRARTFLIDPDWQPWHDGGFPPFGEVVGDQPVSYGRGPDHHDAFDLAREASAIVSKPGGGTLLDSLWSATPVVLLEPVGRHEAANAQLWEQLGFGVSFDRWCARGWSVEVLAALHVNLVAARDRIPSYVDSFVPTRR